MPIDISNLNGTMRRDVAERFQILNLLEANEDITKMRMEAYFVTSPELGKSATNKLQRRQKFLNP